jgi:hypothetical protein
VELEFEVAVIRTGGGPAGVQVGASDRVAEECIAELWSKGVIV